MMQDSSTYPALYHQTLQGPNQHSFSSLINSSAMFSYAFLQYMCLRFCMLNALVIFGISSENSGHIQKGCKLGIIIQNSCQIQGGCKFGISIQNSCHIQGVCTFGISIQTSCHIQGVCTFGISIQTSCHIQGGCKFRIGIQNSCHIQGGCTFPGTGYILAMARV